MLDEQLATSLLYHGDALRNEGRTTEALACYVGCEHVARQHGLYAIVVQSLERRVLFHLEAAAYGLAEEVALRGIEVCAMQDDVPAMLAFQSLRCLILRRQGDVDGALDVAFDALDMARREQLGEQELAFLAQMGELARERGDDDELRRIAACGLRHARERQDLRWTTVFALLSARAASAALPAPTE